MLFQITLENIKLQYAQILRKMYFIFRIFYFMTDDRQLQSLKNFLKEENTKSVRFKNCFYFTFFAFLLFGCVFYILHPFPFVASYNNGV